MDCQGNHAFSHSANLFIFKNIFVLDLGGPNEQFGIHEIFFWGQKVSYTGCLGTREYLTFARYSGWGKSIQIGADFN